MKFQSASSDTSTTISHFAARGAWQPVAIVGGSPTVSYGWMSERAAAASGQGDLITYGYANCPADIYNVHILESDNTNIISLVIGEGIYPTCAHYDHDTFIGLGKSHAAFLGEGTTTALAIHDGYITNSIITGGAWGIIDGNPNDQWSVAKSFNGAGAHHNVTYNVSIPYVRNFGGSPGFDNGTVHHPNSLYGDLTVDPAFLAPQLTPEIFDSSLGGPGTVVHFVQELAKRSGFGGAYDTRYNPSRLVDFLRQGVAPTNPGLHQAGSDGTDIGAVPVSTQQPQTITFPNPGTQSYGVAPITLTATASSGLPVTYSVISGPAIVSGNVLRITGAGSVTVEADQSGDSNWLPASPVQDSFTVNPAVLTVTANSASMTYGGTLPTFTASISGFVNGDGLGVVSGAPSLTTTAQSSSPVGTYPIMAAQGTLSAQNYTFTFMGGTLTIQQAVSSGTLMSSSNSLYVTQAATLTATVSVIGSGGAPTGTVNFMLGPTWLGTGTLTATDGTDASATIQLMGSQLTIGPNSITAVYAGDSNYSGSTSLPITVTLLSSGLSFGSANVGTAAPVQTLTYIFNNDATLSAINILTQGVTGLDYTDGGSSSCAVGMPYTAGQSCTVTVAFNPVAPGGRAGAVTLFADGSNLPLVIWYVTGIGESAAVTIDPGTQTTLASIASALTYGSAIDGAGNVYVADNINGQVIKVAAGTLVQSTVIYGLALPTSVALDGAGNLYIAESSGVIMVPNENGTLNSADVGPVTIDGLGLPQGITLDSNGYLYVTDITHGSVLRVPAGGGVPVTVVSGLTNPHAVAVDAAGDLYVASNNQVSEYPSGGGSVPLGSGYNSPQGIAVDASGTVYVADTGNDQIVEVSAGGGSQSVLAVAGIMAPHGVTVDAAGNLYVSDSASVYEVNRTQAAALNFGSQSVGSTSPAQTLTVSNAGNQQLTVSSLSIPANFTQQPSGGTDCSSTSQLVAGHACAIAAAFAPTTTGVLNGTLTLTDNALNNPAAMQSVGMSGTGTQPQPQPQTITFPNPGTQSYGVAPITLTATASSGLPVTYSVISGPAIVSGNVLRITGAGSVTVEADQSGDSNWLPASPVQDSFTVNPAVLTVTANSASMTYGGTLPTFTASISGFVNGDGLGVVSGAPSLTTTAQSSSPVGTYPIMAAQGTLSAQNYTFTFMGGTLTINPAVLTVTANSLIGTSGRPLPTLTYTITGFVNGDNQSVVTGAPVLTTTATQFSPPGVYRITITQGTLAASNYSFIFVNGTLTLRPGGRLGG